jgi:hypothetical protein
MRNVLRVFLVDDRAQNLLEFDLLLAFGAVVTAVAMIAFLDVITAVLQALMELFGGGRSLPRVWRTDGNPNPLF